MYHQKVLIRSSGQAKSNGSKNLCDFVFAILDWTC